MVHPPSDLVPVAASALDSPTANSALAYFESAAIEAIAMEIAGHARSADLALAEYVECLRAQHASPEAMVVGVKRMLRRSALAQLSTDDATNRHADIVTRCIAVYFGAGPARAD